MSDFQVGQELKSLGNLWRSYSTICVTAHPRRMYTLYQQLCMPYWTVPVTEQQTSGTSTSGLLLSFLPVNKCSFHNSVIYGSWFLLNHFVEKNCETLCNRNKDELITYVLWWIPTFGRNRVSRPAKTFLHQMCGGHNMHLRRPAKSVGW